MTKMTDQAIQNAHDICMERDKKVVVFGEDVGSAVFSAVRLRPQEEYGKDAALTRRSAGSALSAPPSAWPLTVFAPASKCSSRICLPGLRPDRFRGRTPTLSLCEQGPTWSIVIRMPSDGGIYGGQTQPSRPFHPCVGPEDGHAVDACR